MMSRRTLLTGTAAVALTCSACADIEMGGNRSTSPSSDGPSRGRLGFDPSASSGSERGPSGEHTVRGREAAPPALLYAPGTGGGTPLRLVLLLHGAGSSPERGLRPLREHADRHRLLLVAPQSIGNTWDVLSGAYGPDVRNIARLLETVAGKYPVRGYSIGGFSDGASYALSLGIANGDVFDSVIAFSPGFMAERTRRGQPRFYFSHGTDDQVLPIEKCSRRLVPALREDGYRVTYTEFDGGHTVPPQIAREAARWLASG